MDNLFSLDGKLYHFLCKVSDCMILSVLWLICSLPLVTVGIASSALYHGALHCVREGNGSAARYFFRGIRDNWKQAGMLTLAALVFSLVLYALSRLTRGRAGILLSVLLVFLLAWLHYGFSYVARFHAPTKQVLANTLAICFMNLPASLSMAVLLCITVFALAWFFPASGILLLLLPGVYALISSYLLEKIYGKYASSGSQSETD